ncbi:MAG: aminotransferase [Alphaproteobacteria bacterium PA2]|nr:MAG: aminotransferase [Alphaproteobacteria bacterium PA2]
MALTRRGLMGAALAAGPAAGASERDWAQVAAQYTVTAETIQLENGNWGMMAQPVLAAYERHLRRVNRETSFYSRRGYGADLERVRTRAATSLGVSPDEIAFTRGATEALQALIGGYNRLRPGDAVLYADHDYDAMQTAVRWLKVRRQVDVISMNLPEPATHQGLIDAYSAALASHPQVRMILLTHVSHRNGLVLPVAEITAMARARGVDVILDSAHAWGQLDFRLPDLGADFVGLNGHKWIGAPQGVGVLYIRRARIGDIDPFMGEDQTPPDDVRARVHSGTANMAAFLALNEAIDFHEAIGVKAKQQRLTALHRVWSEPLRSLAGVQVLTPTDSRLVSAIGAFRLSGRTTEADNVALARRLLDQFGIFTVHRTGLAGGACVRVTPALFTTEADVLKLATAVRVIAQGQV